MDLREGRSDSTNLIYPARFHPLAGAALFVSKENRVLAEVRESKKNLPMHFDFVLVLLLP